MNNSTPGDCLRSVIKKFLLITCLFVATVARAQVGIGTTKPDSSAALEIKDTTRGLLVPRMTSAQRIAIRNPAEGLMVYQLDTLRGFWFFSNHQWQSVAPLNNGGKQTAVLTDDITDAQAKQKISEEVGPNTQILRIISCTQLTTVDLSALTSAVQIYIVDDSALQTVNLSKLSYVEGSMYIGQCNKLSALNLSSLARISGTGQTGSQYAFGIESTGIVNLSFPSLSQLSGSFYAAANNMLASISFPALIKAGTAYSSMEITGNSHLTSIVLTKLSTIASISLYDLPKLNTFSAPLLSTLQQLFVRLTKISAITLPALTSVGTALTFDNDSTLSNLSLPLLVNAPLNITNNHDLSTVNLTALKTGSLSFSLNPVLTNLALPSYTGGSANFSSNGLKTLSLPVATSFDNLTVNDNTALTTLSMALAKTVLTFSVTSNPALSSLNLPALDSIQQFTFEQNQALSSLSLPKLTRGGALDIEQNASLSAVLFPALVSVNSLGISLSPLLANLSFSSLTSVASFDISSNVLTNVSLPNLVTITNGNGFSIKAKNLASVSFDKLSAMSNYTFTISGKLPSTQVNYVLNKLVNVNPPITGANIGLSQTPAAPPTGQGITDKATLVSRGNSVTTN